MTKVSDGESGRGGVGIPPTPGCTFSASFPDTSRGAAPLSHTYALINDSDAPVTIDTLSLSSATPSLWRLDVAPGLHVLQPGALLNFTVTFTPP